MYHVYIHIYIYVCVCVCVVHSIGLQTFLYRHLKLFVDSWKFTILLLYILWDDWRTFIISGSNEQLQQQLEYTLLKPDCHSWWISKMKSGCEDTLEERYTIKFCFKLEKRRQKRMECFRLLLEHLAWIEHQFLSVNKTFKEGRESLRDDVRCGRSKQDNTLELIVQRVRVWLIMLRF